MKCILFVVDSIKNHVLFFSRTEFETVHFFLTAGDCYEPIKKETEIIKKLYVKNGSPPTEETIVLYNNEKLPEGEFWNGKRIVELKKDRPSWFSNDLKKRWNKLISSEKT